MSSISPTQWFPEVRHFCRDIPVILIGCKTDLRKDKECTRKLKATNQVPVTYRQVRPLRQIRHYNCPVSLTETRLQGEETRQQMNAELYLECSAKYQENVEEIFREATKRTLAFIRKQKNHKRKNKCTILWQQQEVPLTQRQRHDAPSQGMHKVIGHIVFQMLKWAYSWGF